MPLTLVTDHKKERKDINKFCDLKSYYRKEASLRIQHAQLHGLCPFVLPCLHIKGLPGIKPCGGKKDATLPPPACGGNRKKVDMG